MRKAIYPGSFDPITLGHLDVVSRALKLFDRVVVAVMCNKQKTPMFTSTERCNLIKQSVKELGIDSDRLEIIESDGLLVDVAKECGADFIVKGLRAMSDFESEFQMATANQVLSNDLDSVFVMTNSRYMYLSSSIVREVSYFGGDISKFVTDCVEKAVTEHHRRNHV